MHPVTGYRQLSHIGRQIQEPAFALLNWPQVAYSLMAVAMWVSSDVALLWGGMVTAVGLLALSVRQNEFMVAWVWVVGVSTLRRQAQQPATVEIASGWQTRRPTQGAIVYKVAGAEVVGKV